MAEQTRRNILFVSRRNPHGGRYAEALFNFYAQRARSPWRATARTIWARPALPRPAASRTATVSCRPGPAVLTLIDLMEAEKRVALSAASDRPLIHDLFPEWTDRIEYWHVRDLDIHRALDTDTVVFIERNVDRLLAELRAAQLLSAS